MGLFAHASVGTETNRRSSVKKAVEKRDGITECVRGEGGGAHWTSRGYYHLQPK